MAFQYRILTLPEIVQLGNPINPNNPIEAYLNFLGADDWDIVWIFGAHETPRGQETYFFKKIV